MLSFAFHKRQDAVPEEWASRLRSSDGRERVVAHAIEPSISATGHRPKPESGLSGGLEATVQRCSESHKCMGAAQA
jgi:hypothetical protein